MAVLPCNQIKITTPSGQEMDVLTVLQDLGSVELIESKEAPALSDERIQKENEILEQADIANKAIDILKEYTKKGSMLSSLEDTRMVVSREEMSSFQAKKGELLAHAEEIVNKNHTKEQLLNEAGQLEETVKKVKAFKDIELPLFGDFKYVNFIPFFIDTTRREKVVLDMETNFSDIVLESIDKVGEDYVYIAAVSKEHHEEIFAYLVDNATVINVQTTVQGSFKDVYEQSVKQLEKIKAEITSIEEFTKQSYKRYKELFILKDLLKSDLQKLFSLHHFHKEGTESVSIKGWVNPLHTDEVKKEMEALPQTRVAVSKPQGEAKIVLQNNGFFKNFEVVTKMMGLPTGKSVDPTPFLAVFFVLMFGLALSEAGYALVILLATGAILMKKNIKQNVRSLLSVIFYCAISTVIIGALFGSWFGVTPEDIVVTNLANALPHTHFFANIGLIELLQKFQLINPLKQVVTLMVAMGVLGLIHLSFGLILNFIQHAKRGETLEGVFVSLSWLGFLLLSIVTVMASMGILGETLQANVSMITYVLLAYIVVMVFIVGREAKSIIGKFVKGLFDIFFGIVGYISDTLSYTRLVALGLATGIIASVVNTLAKLAGGGLTMQGGGKMILGYFIIIAIYLLGHTFNLALNVLGSYITCARLNFVEFFGKFFESGGDELSPFKRSEESIRIVSQNK